MEEIKQMSIPLLAVIVLTMSEKWHLDLVKYSGNLVLLTPFVFSASSAVLQKLFVVKNIDNFIKYKNN